MTTQNKLLTAEVDNTCEKKTLLKKKRTESTQSMKVHNINTKRMNCLSINEGLTASALCNHPELPKDVEHIEGKRKISLRKLSLTIESPARTTKGSQQSIEYPIQHTFNQANMSGPRSHSSSYNGEENPIPPGLHTVSHNPSAVYESLTTSDTSVPLRVSPNSIKGALKTQGVEVSW